MSVFHEKSTACNHCLTDGQIGAQTNHRVHILSDLYIMFRSMARQWAVLPSACTVMCWSLLLNDDWCSNSHCSCFKDEVCLNGAPGGCALELTCLWGMNEQMPDWEGLTGLGEGDIHFFPVFASNSNYSFIKPRQGLGGFSLLHFQTSGNVFNLA